MAVDSSLRPGSGRPQEPGRPSSAEGGGTRRGLFLALAVLGVWSIHTLDLAPADLVPGSGGLTLARQFFARALSPALTSEAQFVPDGTPPLLWIALSAAGTTLIYATAALGLAIVMGLVLGFLSSSAWWAGDPAGADSRVVRWLRRIAAPALQVSARTLISFMRSIHELIWAVLFLAAIGLSELAAVFAIAIPFAGVLAKVFSEVIDEVPRDGALALRGVGASGTQVFCFALLPAALPELIAYAFYRLECALRSAAVLGFFGFPTLGLQIRQSFSSTSYGEVWTFLYVLIALVMLFDVWSSAVRRRLLT